MAKKLSILTNLFVGVMSFAAWLLMTSFANEAAVLESGGLGNLRFFTVLSNLFNGAVALACAVRLMRGHKLSEGEKTLKLVAVSAVGLTFLTVVLFLGPLYGYDTMYSGANLWFHLLLPVLSFVDFVVLSPCELPFGSSLWAVLPPVAYAAGYVGNILLNGIGAWPDSNDFYGFLNWGAGVGAVIALSIFLITWLCALALRAASGMCARHRRHS